MTLSEEKFMEIAAAVMGDETPIQVTINIKEAWLLISAIQLAHRHPGLSRPMKKAIKKIADQFTEPIIDRHPDARVPLRMGWNSAFDVEEKKD